jgi:hypothetical protein
VVSALRYLGARSPNPFRFRGLGRGVTLERLLRLVAGIVIMVSLALARWVDPRFAYVAFFVGANLFQFALTDWCPLVPIMRALGVRSADAHA